jgi:hypothetical protein
MANQLWGGCGSASVGAVEVAEFDANGLARLHCNGNIPSETTVAGTGVHAQSADPVGASGNAIDRSVAVEIGDNFRDQVLELSGVGSELGSAGVVLQMEIVPGGFGIDIGELEFDALDGVGMGVDEVASLGEPFFLELLIFFGIGGLIGFFVLGRGQAFGDPSGIVFFVSIEKFRDVHDVVGGDHAIDVNGSEIHFLVGLEPGFHRGRVAPLIDEFVPSGKSFFTSDVFGHVGVAPREDVKGELPNWFGLSAAGSDVDGEIDVAGSDLSREKSGKKESGGKRQKHAWGLSHGSHRSRLREGGINQVKAGLSNAARVGGREKDKQGGWRIFGLTQDIS